MIVLDTSALVELLLNTPRAAAVRAAIGSDHLHAPHLIDVEVVQVLRRFRRRKVLADPEFETAVEDFLQLRMRRHDHRPLLPRIVELVENATAYDACYLALAEELDADLVTCDSKLAGVPGSRARVRVATA